MKSNVNILEKGNVFFFYRPKLGKIPSSQEDVQRTFMVLSPQRGKKRLIVLGEKELPEKKMSKNWGFVQKIGDGDDIKDELSPGSYETKTRGKREIPTTRAAGEGVYLIAKHGNHSHLAYALELPKETEEVQNELKIKEQQNMIVTVKNPEASSPPATGLQKEQKAEYPKEVKEKFQEKRFSPLEPEFLDHEGAELIFIDTGKKISEDLGISLDAEDETESSAEIFNDLQIDKKEHPTKPLFEGKWE